LGPEISQESIREQIEAETPNRKMTSATLELPFTDECKRVLAYAAEEALRLERNQIGIEHLLLGLLHEEGCYAAQMLQRRGVKLELIRRELLSSSLRIHSGQSVGGSLAASGRPVDETETLQPVERRKQPRRSFEQYTERARCALFFARFEARKLATSHVETEHLLLGLLREGKAHLHLFVEPATALESIRRQVEQHTPRGNDIPMSVDLPFTEECRRALQYGAEEAQRLHRDLIGPEHLLMGILRATQSFAAQMLRERGADLEEIRNKLGEYSPAT
jgi:ATP-dependent Clp protease ATP-binding subunit ClpA